MRLTLIFVFAAIAVITAGCESHAGTASPQAQLAISKLPSPVISAFRHQYTNIESARARSRLMPDQQFEYVIDFVDSSGQRRTVRYRGDGSTIP